MDESCERMFGPAARPGDFAGNGAPRWKQRALYDALKDAGAAAGLARLARVSVHDVVDGRRLGDVLEGFGPVSPEQILAVVNERTMASVDRH